MSQIIRELSLEMVNRLDAQRKWVKSHYTDESNENYNTIGGKLILLDTIIKSGWINKDETLKLQCLGITLGDVFVQDFKFRWIEVEEETEVNPALQYMDTSLILFPLTMISQRIENDEMIDIVDFYKGLSSKIIEIKESIDKN